MVLDQDFEDAFVFPSFPSNTASPCYPTVPFLDFPVEVQIHIMRHCEYKTLKQLQRTCKPIKAVLENPVFDRILFRPTAKPLSKDELLRLRNESPAGQKGNIVQLHPLIRSQFCAFQLIGSQVLNENATNPPVRQSAVLMDGVKQVQVVKGARPITLADLIQAKLKLCMRWGQAFASDPDHNLWVNFGRNTLAVNKAGVTEDGILVFKLGRSCWLNDNHNDSRRHGVLRFPFEPSITS